MLFAIPRTSGWLAQWLELVDDPEQKIARPKQIYTGEPPARLPVGQRALELSRPRSTKGASRTAGGALRRSPTVA